METRDLRAGFLLYRRYLNLLISAGKEELTGFTERDVAEGAVTNGRGIRVRILGKDFDTGIFTISGNWILWC